MTNPIVKATAENHFVPVMIVNNKGGYDSKVLKKFREPAWNYQVMRFIDGDEKDIIPRKDQVWETLPFLQRMKQTLEKEKKPVPKYLDLAISEMDTKNHKTIAIAQYCYWTGEAKLGRIEGVVSTEAGWFGGHEVTKLTYDSKVLEIKDLLTQAKALECATAAFIQDKGDLEKATKAQILPTKALTSSYRKAKASDQKKQVNTIQFPESVTAAQMTKFNSFFHGDRKKAFAFLTEDQLSSLKVAR